MPAPYLLDTTVLLHWTRNSPQAQTIDANFQLSSSAMRPLVCEVSLGEMLAFSLSRSWGTQKLRRLAELERHVVVVHISDPGVRQAYAELSTLAQSSGWSLFHGKNDLWVGAAAHAADAHLLTMDTDFLPLRGRAGWSITVLDDKTGLRSSGRHHANEPTGSGGNTEGNRASREVFPPTSSSRATRFAQDRPVRTTTASDKCRSLRRLRAVGIGRRSVPPTWWCPRRSGHQQRYRGVSDHPK